MRSFPRSETIELVCPRISDTTPVDFGHTLPFTDLGGVLVLMLIFRTVCGFVYPLPSGTLSKAAIPDLVSDSTATVASARL